MTTLSGSLENARLTDCGQEVTGCFRQVNEEERTLPVVACWQLRPFPEVADCGINLRAPYCGDLR
jgi:hypothetical protein